MSEYKPQQPIQNNPGNVYEKPVARMFDLYLTGDIKEAKEYQDWNQIMRTTSENDAIVLHILLVVSRIAYENIPNPISIDK